MSEEKQENIIQGVVVESLPNATFRVATDNNGKILVYLSGKMRLHRVRVLIGDRVEVVSDQYGVKGRIVKRF